MSNKPLQIGEEAKVQMPMKTVASLIIIVALGTMGYFQIIERLNVADTRLQLMEKDLEENTEFRIKWPRGQLGSLPADSEPSWPRGHLILNSVFSVKSLVINSTCVESLF